MATKARALNITIHLSILTLLAAAATPTYANERLSRSIESQASTGGEQPSAGASKNDELDALVVSGPRDKTTRGSVQNNAMAPNIDFWVYAADVELYSDRDRDGYYVGIDLEFDADTLYSSAEVYAVIYLSYEFGPWNEYASTADFLIFGASANDAYRIETELVSGYATGDYDILIELFDAYDGSFVASFGPEDNQELSYLPLEDIDRDTPQQTTVIVSQGGGGSLGLLGLLALLATAGLRHSRTAARPPV